MGDDTGEAPSSWVLDEATAQFAARHVAPISLSECRLDGFQFVFGFEDQVWATTGLALCVASVDTEQAWEWRMPTEEFAAATAKPGAVEVTRGPSLEGPYSRMLPSLDRCTRRRWRRATVDPLAILDALGEVDETEEDWEPVHLTELPVPRCSDEDDQLQLDPILLRDVLLCCPPGEATIYRGPANQPVCITVGEWRAIVAPVRPKPT